MDKAEVTAAFSPLWLKKLNEYSEKAEALKHSITTESISLLYNKELTLKFGTSPLQPLFLMPQKNREWCIFYRTILHDYIDLN